MASDESLVATIAAFAKNIEDQKLLLKAKDEEIAALKAQLKAASLVDTKTDTQPGETKLSRVELAKQQICKASFACFKRIYRIGDAKKRVVLYCCMYSKISLDIFCTVLLICGIVPVVYLYPPKYISDQYECGGGSLSLHQLISVFRNFDTQLWEAITVGSPVIYDGDLVRVYCNEKTYKKIVEQGLFDNEVFVMSFNNDEE